MSQFNSLGKDKGKFSYQGKQRTDKRMEVRAQLQVLEDAENKVVTEDFRQSMLLTLVCHFLLYHSSSLEILMPVFY